MTNMPRVSGEAAAPLAPFGLLLARRRSLPLWLFFTCCAAGLILLALITPISHDEDQYIGAAMLAPAGLPFADFLYLQTPLQPLLAAPLVGLWPGHALLVLRLAGALLALLSLIAIHKAARLGGATERGARTAILLLLTCHAFLFGAGLVRNDILPMAFLSFALLAGVAALDRPRASGLWLIAGLCLGAATSAKISYALPAAGAGLFLLPGLKRDGWRPLTGFALGTCLGLLPTLLAWFQAPEAFNYGVFRFASAAPYEYYTLNGHGFRLGVTGKSVDSLVAMLMGPILPALLICAGAFLWRLRQPPGRVRFLEMMILSGLVAALLPTPTWRQYFIPLLPPLFVRLACLPLPAARLARALIGLTMLAGLAPHAVHLVRAATDGAPILNVEREAEWIGAVTARQGGCGLVATLSPHLAVDSGLPLDRRFAAGPFFYRTGDMLPPDKVVRLHAISPDTLAAELDRAPPAAIVTGYENGSAIDRVDLDAGLIRYALSRGYPAFDSPAGDARLFIRPGNRPCS